MQKPAMKKHLYIAAIEVEDESIWKGAERAATHLVNLCRGDSEFGLTLEVFDPNKGTGLKIKRHLELATKVCLVKNKDADKKAYAELDRCKMIAELAHYGQFRRDGYTPYVTHPFAVADACKSVTAKCVAVLHDAMEDNDLVTPALLKRFGVSPVVVEAAKAITKFPGELYERYLERVAANKLATEVKVEDIRHNLRSNPKPEKVQTYMDALEFLTKQLKCQKPKAKKSKRKASSPKV